MDKQTVVHPHNEISLSNKNELSQGDTTSYSLGELHDKKGRKQQCGEGVGKSEPLGTADWTVT